MKPTATPQAAKAAPQDISVSVYFVGAVLRQAHSKGIDTTRLLRRSRISPRLLAQPQARVGAEQYARLQALTMREMEDEMLGYGAAPARLGQWSALCHWLIHCRTLGQAMRRCCLFFAMMPHNLQPSLRVAGSSATLEIHAPAGGLTADEPYAYELFCFSLHRLFCWLIQAGLSLQEVRLPYPQPAHAAEYRPMFPGARCSFGQDSCQLVFDRQWLEKPLRQSADELAAFLRNPLYFTLVNSVHYKSWLQRVKLAIGTDLRQLPGFEQLAQALSVNPKQLQRLLKKEGLNYAELKAQLRRDAAIYYLSQTTHSIEEIAYITGYSEASAFIRAFKAQTGLTPMTYRKDLR